MNYEDVVILENSNKVYLCTLPNGTEEEFQVRDNGEGKVVLYNFNDENDSKEYLKCDILDILEEIPYEYEEPLIDEEAIKPFKTHVSNVYSYSTLEELEQIKMLLKEHTNCDYKEIDLKYNHGLVYTYYEYDDFSCYGDGCSNFYKIIDGGKIG